MHTTEQLNVALTGRYVIEREVGQGGMATVYLARDVKHNRRVAVKVLSAELAAVVGRERFLSEIEVTANLQHPHLLPLFDSGDAGGLLFYVMPFIEGETLRKRLERERQLTIDDALHIATAIGSALDYAHRRGVIHRDLKPENILMHERDPLVMDFGIALAVSNAGGARVTQAGISLGTPQYMSPEQATGDRQIDARSDIYSLGAVTYEMLGGEPPHSGTTIQAVMAKVIGDKPRAVRTLRETVPEYVEEAVMRALAKLPADRFATAAEFVSAITGARSLAVTGVRSQVALTGMVRALPYTPERKPLVTRRALSFGAVGIVLAALAGAVGARALHTDPADPSGRFVIPLPDSVTFSNTSYRQVALSRDGTRAVFHLSTSFPDPLYTRRMGEMHLDVIPGSDSARSMVISPDARHALYWLVDNSAGGLLMKIPIEGGPKVKLADSTVHTQASWGDGDQVLFRRRGDLFVVSANGGPERLVAKPDTVLKQGALGWPDMLPGGEAALITILHGSTAVVDSLYLGVVFLDDGKVVDLGVRGMTPKYASGHVLYVRTDGQLFARPFNRTTGEFTGDERAIAKDLNARNAGSDLARGVTDLAVSESGTILLTEGGAALVGGGGTGRTIVVRRVSESRNEWLQVARRQYVDVRASPDGARLALTIQDATNAREDVWLFTFATGQTTPFTRDGMSGHPVWSPDGRRIIYRMTDPRGKPVRRFYSAPWDESEPPKPFAGADGAESIAFAGPQGRYIAYVRGDSGTTDSELTDSHIYIAPVDSPSVQRPLAALGIREREPRFSPDGKWLAYTGHELPSTGSGTGVGNAVLYLRPVPGPGAVTTVSQPEGNTPMWSRDGRTLFYFAGGGPAPFVSAGVSTSGAVAPMRNSVFPRGAPGGSPHRPVARWSADILPNGDVVYITNQNAPASAIASNSTTAAAPAPAAVRLVAVMNWLSSQTAR